MPCVGSAGLASHPAVVQLLPSVSAQGVLASGVVVQAPVVVLHTLLVQVSPVQVCCWCVWTHTPTVGLPGAASQPAVVQALPSVSAQGWLVSGAVSQAPVVVLQTLLVQASPVQVWVWWVCTQMPWVASAGSSSQPAVVQLLLSVSGHGVLTWTGVNTHAPVSLLHEAVLQVVSLQTGHSGNDPEPAPLAALPLLQGLPEKNVFSNTVPEEARPTTLMSNSNSQKSVLDGMTIGELGVNTTSFGEVPTACPEVQVIPVQVVVIVASPRYWITAPSSVQGMVFPVVPLTQSRSKLILCTVSVPGLGWMMPATKSRRTRTISSPVMPGGTGCGLFTPDT